MTLDMEHIVISPETTIGQARPSKARRSGEGIGAEIRML